MCHHTYSIVASSKLYWNKRRFDANCFRMSLLKSLQIIVPGCGWLIMEMHMSMHTYSYVHLAGYHHPWQVRCLVTK